MMESDTKQKSVELYLESCLAEGLWKPGDKLPPERDLAAQLCVSRNTVRTALRLLCGKDLLVSRKKSGTFVLEPKRAMRPPSQVLYESIAGFSLFFPVIAREAVFSVTAQDIPGLEALLSPVGFALNFGTGSEFCKAQAAFIEGLVAAVHNEQLTQAMGCLIPKGRQFTKCMSMVPHQIQENIFASLAQLLGGIRRVDMEAALKHAHEYTGILASLVEPQ